VAKKVGETRDRLFDGADATHHLGTLLQELTQLLVGLPHDFLDMAIAKVSDRFDRACAVLDLHTPSNQIQGQAHGRSLTGTQETAQGFPDFHSGQGESVKSQPLCIRRWNLDLVTS